MTKPRLLLIGVTALAAVAGGVAAAVWPEPEPPPQPTQDTGFSREKTEEVMRTIGYVQ